MYVCMCLLYFSLAQFDCVYSHNYWHLSYTKGFADFILSALSALTATLLCGSIWWFDLMRIFAKWKCRVEMFIIGVSVLGIVCIF